MKVILAYRGGPANRTREEMIVRHAKPLLVRTKTNIADDLVARYEFKEIHSAPGVVEWVYELAALMTIAGFRAWRKALRESLGLAPIVGF